MTEKQTRKNLIFFPLGTVGRDMMYSLFTNFILTYILFTRTLDNAQLGAITTIMVLARVFDALNDPIMGNIIDRTRTKIGKFKPWLIIGIVLTSFVIYGAFNSKLQGWSFVWYFAFIYFMYSITYTMHDISYWGMIPSLGSDANLRDKFTSRTTLFAGIGGTIAGFLIPMLTAGSSAIGGSATRAYGILALVIAIIGPLFLTFTIVGVKEDRSYEKEPAPHVSLKKIFSVIKDNDQLLWVSLVFLIQQIGNNIALGGIGSTYIYFELGYEGGFYSNFSTFGLAATAILMATYPMISAKINRKKLMKLMLYVSGTGYLAMLLIGLFMPVSNPNLKCWVFTVAYMAANFGIYSYYLMLMISILNTVEYNEYKQGERNDAIIASLRPFLTKLGSAFTVILTTLSYMLFNVTEHTNKISSLEQACTAGTINEEEKLSQINSLLSNIRPGQKTGLLLFITVLPFALMLIAYLIYEKHYKLDEDEYDRICTELENRKISKASKESV